MKTELLPLSFLAKALLIAFVTLVAGNLLSFWALYGDTFTPFTLPYHENFDQPIRLSYRQFGGFWRISEGSLLQTDNTGTDLLAVIPLTVSAAQPYHMETAINMVSGQNGGGLLFNLQQANSRRQSHLVRFGTDQGQNYLVFGYFDEAMNFVSQGSVTPPDLSQGARLAVDVHETNYDVLVNDQIAQRAIPLHYKGGNLALITWFSSVRFDDIAVHAIETQLPGDVPASETSKIPINDTAPPERAAQAVAPSNPTHTQNVHMVDSAALSTTMTISTVNAALDSTLLVAGALGAWKSMGGQWVYGQGKIVQTIPEGFDYGLSRTGSVKESEISVRLRHRQGVGGGLLFGLPTQNSRNGGHMVRFFEDNSVAWGYYDATGVFEGQGYAVVPAPGTRAHTLKVAMRKDTYSVVLDDQPLADDIPLISKEGHIGFTASNSVVEFDKLTIVALRK